MWGRVGELLERRRVELDPRYRNLRLFTSERGIDYRLAWDAEHGARANYRRPTLTGIEVAYGWRPGSIHLVLAGGDPIPSREAARGIEDGRPLFDDPQDQAVADRAWEAAPGLDPEVRRGAAALAVQIAARRRDSSNYQDVRRRA